MAGDLKEFQVSQGYIAMSRVWGLLSITAAAFVGFQDTRSAEALPKPAQAEQVTVTGQATGSLTSASSEDHGNQTEDRISLDQTYTLNDFHFEGDPVYHDNRIAGIPIHFYEAQLLYQKPSGFYAGPNLQCNLSRYPADHANTLFADA